MKKPSCRIQTLAGDGLCRVDYCPDCMIFHLKIGYASLQISPEALSTLCGTLNTAMARFHRQKKITAGPSLQHCGPIS
jgi:hypothetical protein